MKLVCLISTHKNLRMSHQRGPPEVCLGLALEGILDVSWEEAAAAAEG